MWKARQLIAAGEIDGDGFLELATSAASVGYCNTMGGQHDEFSCRSLACNYLVLPQSLHLTARGKYPIAQVRGLLIWFGKISSHLTL